MDLMDLKTLIIDDNATNRLILKEMLSKWGAVVSEAEGGEEGLAEMARAKDAGKAFSLVLLDKRMPGVDGFQVAERIHQEPGLAPPTILMLTSENRAGDVARGRELGVAAYLVKPVKQAELLEAIQEARGGVTAATNRSVVPSRRSANTTTHSLRILLAEDSPDNVLLIESYLKTNGYTADLARDGEIAFQKFISGSYDIVLMDVQMPVMDGYQATRKIRQWEKSNGLKTAPILALTAHALPEEVQKSLDAGCTAHLTKPIRKMTLLDAIELHTQGLVRLDMNLKGLVPGFLVNRRTDIDVIAAALQIPDFESIRVVGHNMRGSGAGYGFQRITDIGALLEDAAIRCSPAEIRDGAADLGRYLDRLHVEYE